MIIFYSANVYLVPPITRDCKNLFYHVSNITVHLWWSHQYGSHSLHLCIAAALPRVILSRFTVFSCFDAMIEHSNSFLYTWNIKTWKLDCTLKQTFWTNIWTTGQPLLLKLQSDGILDYNKLQTDNSPVIQILVNKYVCWHFWFRLFWKNWDIFNFVD